MSIYASSGLPVKEREYVPELIQYIHDSGLSKTFNYVEDDEFISLENPLWKELGSIQKFFVVKPLPEDGVAMYFIEPKSTLLFEKAFTHITPRGDYKQIAFNANYEGYDVLDILPFHIVEAFQGVQRQAAQALKLDKKYANNGIAVLNLIDMKQHDVANCGVIMQEILKKTYNKNIIKAQEILAVSPNVSLDLFKIIMVNEVDFVSYPEIFDLPVEIAKAYLE